MPAHALGAADSTGERHNAASTGLREPSAFLSGPISMPVPAQKRVKRQQEPCELIPSGCDEQTPAASFCHRGGEDLLSYQLSYRGPQTPGRAPPPSV